MAVVIDPLPNFAANLRRIRKEKRLTQDALASGAMMDAAEIRRLERARRDPGVRVVARLAKGLGVEPHELLIGIARQPLAAADGSADPDDAAEPTTGA